MRVEILRVESGTSFWTTGQDRTKKERRPIDFAIDMFGEGRKEGVRIEDCAYVLDNLKAVADRSKRWDIDDV